jgi:hypothetical protein
VDENTNNDPTTAAITKYISSALASYEQDDRADWYLTVYGK